MTYLQYGVHAKAHYVAKFGMLVANVHEYVLDVAQVMHTHGTFRTYPLLGKKYHICCRINKIYIRSE
jgi:hypothetical protein